MTAKVVATAPSKESAAYLHVEISFDNPGGRACKILRYTLAWPGGKKAISLESFSVPPREQRTRSVKVHPDDGDLASLKPEAAQVTLETECP
jgi:hypothetical protein